MKALKSTFTNLLLPVVVCLLLPGCNGEKIGITLAVLIIIATVGVIVYRLRAIIKRRKSEGVSSDLQQAQFWEYIIDQANQDTNDVSQYAVPRPITSQDLVEVSNTLNALHVRMDVLFKRYREEPNASQYFKDFMVIAYITKRGIVDRFDLNGWSTTVNDIGINVPDYSDELLRLGDTVQVTLERVNAIAGTLDLERRLKEMMAKGPIYHEVQSNISEEVKAILGSA
jgi:hypothetical protein